MELAIAVWQSAVVARCTFAQYFVSMVSATFQWRFYGWGEESFSVLSGSMYMRRQLGAYEHYTYVMASISCVGVLGDLGWSFTQPSLAARYAACMCLEPLCIGGFVQDIVIKTKQYPDSDACLLFQLFKADS